jgi:hypothetical protein
MQVQFHASLLCVLNEYGQVLAFQITPNDGRDYARSLLSLIWQSEGRTVKTQVVYTDNPTVDTTAVLQTFYLFPQHIDCELFVLLVCILQCMIESESGYLPC